MNISPTLSLSPESAAFHLAAIVESSDDAIASKDLNGIITSWNAGATRLFGYSAEEIVGKSVRLLIPADRQHEEDEVLARVRSGQQVDHYETVRVRKDGSIVEISLTVSPIKDASGRIIGASKIARDISVRKRAEEALIASMEAKEEFLSLVSHELRTPVTILLGTSRILASRFDSLSQDEREAAFSDLLSNSLRLKDVIEHLLILSRMGSQYELTLEFIRPEKIAAEVIATVQARFPARSIQLDAHPRLPIALGEPALLKLVLDNLISNGLKYSNMTDAVEVRLCRGGERYVVVEVADRGIGLTEEDNGRLFEPFYRARRARDKAPGMGLGLAVCKKIVEAQGGTIHASPRPGGGTIFRFNIPMAAGPDQ